ncbi:hypothetical protein [Pseudalkalibacillus caeni]|uniref:Uncharacterized protein n=1 Tax=Exobacillus caeni TaxID=2574798 RepID=A0A5R9EYA9_9BACL|nr:hypothetical protein [Pseudalkalibacillus caeni]TLS35030.1 hypothetical protein FCL54_22485 [Pseudalkalibacillus caeni]
MKKATSFFCTSCLQDFKVGEVVFCCLDTKKHFCRQCLSKESIAIKDMEARVFFSFKSQAL